MSYRLISSRRRFAEYRDELKHKVPPEKSRWRRSSRIRSRSRVRSARELVGQFYRLLGSQRKAVVFALGTLTLSTILALVPPAATKFVVDSVLGDEPLPIDSVFGIALPTDRMTLLIWITGAVLVISLLKSVVAITGRWVATRATKRLQLSVRRKVFEHTVRLPLHRVQELRSGGVASILREDAGSVGELIFGMVYNPWRAVIQLLGSLCILIWVDWRLLLGALTLLPAVYLMHRVWITRIRPQYRDIRGSREEIDAHAAEAFGGMRVVRAFSRQRREAGRFMGNNDFLARQELHTWWWMRTVELVWELLIPLSTTILLLYCGHEVIDGRMSLGDVMMFTVYLLMLLEPIAVLAQSATSFQNSLSGLDRVLDVLEEDREMSNHEETQAVERETVRGEIAFTDVEFRYPGTDRAAITGINFRAQPGETIALVGTSGAGKTTLCNLVARFYDPTAGTVSLDGTDLRDYDVEGYRSLLGIVEQDIFLFDGTIGENIAYARSDATAEEIRWAAGVANADEFIDDLPEGYDTVIGERGVKLSGGQRQRLAIARAVLADPKILILDEATSNLDTRSERLIQESLDELRKNRTSFVIAHRLSTIVHADLILVLEGGRIIEQGRHDDLMAREGRYRSMIRMQVDDLTTMNSIPEGV